MSKFNVGDKVKIVGSHSSSRSKARLFGTVTAVKVVRPNGLYPYELEGDNFWLWDESELEPVNCDKVVITTDGKTTTATHYKEDGTKKVATAKCSPEDTFDFEVGAKLAMERLFKPEPKLYNGKVVCFENTKSNEPLWTIGKIYQFVDGIITTDLGDEIGTWSCGFESFEDWNNYSSSKWIEIKE